MDSTPRARPTTRLSTIPSPTIRSSTPPSPRSTAPERTLPTSHTPIAIAKERYFGENAHAGPSSEGALRRDSEATEWVPLSHGRVCTHARFGLGPSAPSSAPPTPSAIGVTHPPQFIHTHHPRRGSITPFGLNVISPVVPLMAHSTSPGAPISPTRTTGFSPVPVDPNGSPGTSSLRRGSTTSTASTLTQSRPSNLALNAAAGFNRERRRSSLTPSVPTLAPPSPSRALASGRLHGRPASSDGQGADGRVRQKTVDGAPRPLGSLHGARLEAAAVIEARRGSLPQLGAGGSWTGPVKWSPSLPAQRGSLTEPHIDGAPVPTALPDEDFKFGNGAPSPSAAAAALRAFDLNSASRRSSLSKKPMDVFEEAEAIEAERQRKAFIAATYGVDGKRARERLSFTAGSAALAPGSSPPGGSRRPSLMLWERLGGLSASRAAELESQPGASTSTPALPSISTADGDFGQRRGSLPIAIPSTLGRSLSQRGAFGEPLITQSVEEGSSPPESERKASGDVSSPLYVELMQNLYVRPMPPLMPLSDPGPREFPSNLALQRASHLLNSRNLQAEPLPHPLPPSLHPPAPIDMSEFDIDFILAGSRSQLGGKGGMNAPVDVVPKAKGDQVAATPTLKLGPGGEDEDTFAKFVGAFDEEYGDRRGMWSFRACPATATPPGDDSRDPLDTSGGPSRMQLKAEWESHGAGRFGLYHNGEVRSVQTGAVWRVRRSANREYEISEVSRGKSPRSGSIAAPNDCKPHMVVTSGESYILASKARHREFGGIKLAHHGNGSTAGTVRPASGSRQNSTSGPPSAAAKLRASISEATSGRRGRGSEDSGSTAVPLSQSLPLGPGLAAFLPRKKSSRDATAELEAAQQSQQSSPQVAFQASPLPTHFEKAPERPKHKGRSISKERKSEGSDPDEKKKAGKVLGGVLKRAFMHGHDEKKAVKEEKMRERAQAHSWGGSASTSHKAQSYFAPTPASSSTVSRPTIPPPLRPADDLATGKSSIVSGTPSLSESSDKVRDSTDERDRQPSLSSVAEDEGALLREGKGWNPVPDEAIAMVLPLPTEEDMRPVPMTLQSTASIWDSRQVLLVWWVPFEPKKDGEEDRPPTSASAASSQNASEGSSLSSGSIPKLQKLLRRRTSKDKEVLKKGGLEMMTTKSSGSKDPEDGFSPLPFRSFRIVARVIEIDELRSDRDGNHIAGLGFDQWTEHHPGSTNTGSGDSKDSHFANATASTSSSAPSPHAPQSSLAHDDADAASYSTAPTSTIMAGRTFPTVIAVCHSRSQGVEFVLEGLDRLGLCQGESAWGPTGYEEWRGSGLSPKGREMVDIIWVGCTAIMGILAT